jgi:4-alpha-glucanotransferase
MSCTSSNGLLHALARLYGIQTAYYDVNSRRQQASVESLLAVLRSLGAPIANADDVPSALRERQQALWQQLLEPVVVAWDGESHVAEIRLPLDAADFNADCHLKLERGEQLSWKCPMADLTVLKGENLDGRRYVSKQLELPSQLPWGYHDFTLELHGRQARSLVISCPIRTYSPPLESEDRSFGVFLPLYALHSKTSWGAGDFSDLQNLITWVWRMDGHVVATLPLLPTFMNDLSHPSPYSPTSSLLWNEFYLDIASVPELRECRSAQALIGSSAFQNEIKTLRGLHLIDYERQMLLKRQALKEMCRHLFTEEPKRLKELHRFAQENPYVEDYARFSAACERHGSSWRLWPYPLRDGILSEGDYEEENKRYHMYVQWLTNEQMNNVSERAREKSVQLYLDLPLGVHPDGYDVWRKPESFVSDISAGAPPDAVFSQGQNWGLPPLHPERIRQQGYSYVIACLRHHLRYAGILRIDHVMRLHRLFCIPSRFETYQGVYVRYRANELYAILALESHRHKAIIVGEDLGTVPSYVRATMRKHGMQRMFVIHYALASSLQRGLAPISRDSIASLNTHDMHPFAAFWQGLDIEDRKRIGLLDSTGAAEEKNRLLRMKQALVTLLQFTGWLRVEETDIHAILKACLSFLAASEARTVLINLEDLWLETQPQNIPSTTAEYPNWRRRARYTFEQFCQLPQVADTLLAVSDVRKQSERQEYERKRARSRSPRETS